MIRQKTGNDIKKWIRKRKFLLFLLFSLLSAYYFCLPRNMFPDTPYATVVADRNGELLGARIADDGQWRFPPSETVSEKFKQCLLQFEDRYFYFHWGVNPLSVGRALIQNIRNKEVVSGGSTITMQTIRLMRKKPRTVKEKIIEAVLATRLEFRYSKEKILALYASHAPFGGNVVGLEAAAWRYFGHSSQNLSWAEAATLAVLPNAPSMIHLSKNRQALETKRNRLLKRLLDRNLIDRSAYELALTEPLPSEPLPLPQIAPHLVSLLYRTDKGHYIQTTLEKGFQQQIESLLSRWNAEFMRSDIRNIAALVIDVMNNEITAYCGNVNFNEKKSGNQVDIIHAPRSTGSILKPLLYCAMLQEGELLPNTLLPDIPLNINGFAPQNFDLQFNGAVPASEALARSLNVPAVQMLRKYSVPKFYDLLKKAGLTTLTRPASDYGLSLILGGAEGTLWEIASVYSSMAYTLQTGDYRPGYPSIKRSDGTKKNLKGSSPLFRRGAVWQTFEAIKEVNRPEEIDWHIIPSIRPVAWKTGTSYGFRDAWAVGTTSRYVVAVWAGNANGEGKPGLTGASTAGPVMFDIFNLLPASQWFDIPYDDLTEAEICRESGHLKGRFCEHTDTLLVCPAALRTDPCPYHIPINVTSDERYRVYENCAVGNDIKNKTWFVLPPAWEWYYKQHHPEYKPLPPLKAGCGNSGAINPMQFIYPQNNAIIYIPKQLDGSKGAIVFNLAHSNNDATVFWHLDEEYITSTRYFHQLSLTPVPGEHYVTAVDDRGNTLSIRITCK